MNVLVDGRECLLRFVGELDVASREFARRAILDASSLDVTIEMDSVTFMDCCGFGALAAARRELIGRGGSLTLRSFGGQPARLLEMLTGLDSA